MAPFGTRWHFASTESGMNENKAVITLADVSSLVERLDVTGTRRRDMISAIKRISEMAGTMPANIPAQPPHLRELLSRIRPAAHRGTGQSYSNLRNPLVAPLQLARGIHTLPPGDR